MRTFENSTGVPLSMAVYLATDHYDYIPNTISATGLMKPIRQTILGPRVPASLATNDILSVVKSRLGTSIHDGFEKAWVGGHYINAMQKLGYPQGVIDRITVNPEGELASDAIPVYLEIRSFREIDGVTISGKFDFVAEGRVEDLKTTSTYTWVNGTKTDDYRTQGSIYRWLNPEIITADTMLIQFVFTDWMGAKAKADPRYPQRQTEKLEIPLMSLAETEAYIRGRLKQFKAHRDLPEADLPLCTDKELWRKDPAFKYYKNPDKRTKSTKNFNTLLEAQVRLVEDNNVGIVVTVPGKVIACNYCAAYPICTQKDAYLANGTLTAA